MRLQSPWAVATLLIAGASAAASQVRDGEKASTTSTATAIATPCVATSSSGAFYDLRDDMASALKEGEKERKHKGPVDDYRWERPHDWHYNFTMNICAPVVKGVKDVVGVDKALWKNVSAYYEEGGKTYSLGQLNTTLVPRGSQLVLRYSGGSPCGTRKSKDNDKRELHSGASHKDYDHITEVDRPSDWAKEDEEPARRKSAIISFRCDRDIGNTQARLSFIETDEDECTYVFSMLSQHACAKTEPHKPGSVGPGGVFGIIFFVAVAVYLLGGVFYQRTVAHARGWRQLPNYSLWAGIGGFIQDFFIIMTSSCARFLPGRRGYGRLSVGSPSGRNRNREDENRLIDQLDEEWDD
ncbi:mannose-6-phosphate receptor binding domain-containing protein [Coniochaeta sp. 2T2.1]|nr:mannose-6-phosphate receptor binding domain-containing protein [Coniochaeta sp. 2T2.1]